jgi:hypothetical protein
MTKPTTLQIACSIRLVIRNSRSITRVIHPAILAHSIFLEEPLPSPSPHNPAAGTTGDTAAAAIVPQHCRAPAHVVISALRNLWPGVEVWQYPVTAKGLHAWNNLEFPAELLCRQGCDRGQLRSKLFEVLELAGASPAHAGDELTQVA